ncbi:MAG: hypothetical protein OXN94_08205, partial [Chloroflexota bacterium]|nr:hypothetical protein [Chloroflexota bacterium]
MSSRHIEIEADGAACLFIDGGSRDVNVAIQMRRQQPPDVLALRVIVIELCPRNCSVVRQPNQKVTSKVAQSVVDAEAQGVWPGVSHT